MNQCLPPYFKTHTSEISAVMPKHLPLETHKLFCLISDATIVLHWYFRNRFYSGEQTFTPVEAHAKEQIAPSNKQSILSAVKKTVPPYCMHFLLLAFQLI